MIPTIVTGFIPSYWIGLPDTRFGLIESRLVIWQRHGVGRATDMLDHLT
jgi:hypothetical protein